MKPDGSIATRSRAQRRPPVPAGADVASERTAEGFVAPPDERRVVSLAQVTRRAAAYLAEDDL